MIKVNHKFINIQNALDFLSTFALWEHSKRRANKSEHGRGIILIKTFVLKVINHEFMKPLVTLQNKLCRCTKNQNCGFIWTCDGWIFCLLIHVSSPIFVLYKYRPESRNFVKENKKLCLYPLFFVLFIFQCFSSVCFLHFFNVFSTSPTNHEKPDFK